MPVVSGGVDRLKSAGVRVRGASCRPPREGSEPRAGSRWLFAFAALSELPLEPGKWSSLRYVVAQWSKGLANVSHAVFIALSGEDGLRLEV
jgi:hypothetical protein